MVLQLPHAPTVLRREGSEILLGATATVSSRLQRGGQWSYTTLFLGCGGGKSLGNLGRRRYLVITEVLAQRSLSTRRYSKRLLSLLSTRTPLPGKHEKLPLSSPQQCQLRGQQRCQCTVIKTSTSIICISISIRVSVRG
jgi:hypothetical protein